VMCPPQLLHRAALRWDEEVAAATAGGGGGEGAGGGGEPAAKGAVALAQS
jgi:hypothetical protein